LSNQTEKERGGERERERERERRRRRRRRRRREEETEVHFYFTSFIDICLPFLFHPTECIPKMLDEKVKDI